MSEEVQKVIEKRIAAETANVTQLKDKELADKDTDIGTLKMKIVDKGTVSSDKDAKISEIISDKDTVIAG
jgi:hypothetical protein